ncbi:GAF domain protein [Mycobacterium xenopi 4042]|uniref:GAF domain protein n=1 Tax=Mycobacterium xenopi 4042 TaxID=1299334 RepID=X7YK53_MYCXE|nr:GAF domain protein [Mycobacterium xenopi 4042]
MTRRPTRGICRSSRCGAGFHVDGVGADGNRPGGLVGVLNVHTVQRREFTDDDVELLRVIGRLIAGHCIRRGCTANWWLENAHTSCSSSR